MSRVVVAICGVATVAGILACAGSGNPGARVPEPKKERPPLKGPGKPKKQVTQAEFVKLIESFAERYAGAPNDLKKALVQGERKKALQKALSGPSVVNWVGTLKRTRAVRGAEIEVRLEGSQVIVLTNRNRSVFGEEPRIAQGSALYNKIAELTEGDTIVFSGRFLISEAGADHIRENSWTESGSMQEPEFVFRFTDVSKK